MSAVGIAPSPPPTSPSLHDHSIVVYLSVPGSPPLPMRLSAADSVASVKLRIQNSRGFEASRQRLVHGGRELARNGCRVRDYGVRGGNVLHLVLRLSELREICVRTVCGRTFEFRVGRNRSVRYVRDRVVQEAEGVVDLRGHQLVCAGEELDDWVVVDDICKNSNAVIHLLVRRPAKFKRKPVDGDVEILIVVPESHEEAISEDSKPQFRIEPIVVNPKVVHSPVIEELISSTLAGLDMGNSPVRSAAGSGGVYFMPDELGDNYVAVFKPMDEEPLALNNPQGLPISSDGEGLKRGTRVGEGAFREVAAYILDHPLSGCRSYASSEVGFAGVPPTVMVRCSHEGFNYHEGYEHAAENLKIGSLQMFVHNEGSCEDFGPKFFPVEEVHKISVLDIRLANADRHGGNILVCRKGGDGLISLVPIDHGYCLPENFQDCTFEWLYWPQAREHYNSETVQYINSLDAEKDIALLKFYGWELSTKCAQTFRISTMLLKKGVKRGFTPFTIGSIMCRETITKKSVVEEIIDEAKETVLLGSDEIAFMEIVSEIMDRRLDELTQ